MKAINGVYQNGKVILNESVDWPNGAPVQVLSATTAEISGVDVCVDGSISAETPEVVRDWVQWLDSSQPVLTGDELARFEASLASARDEQRNFLSNWQARVDRLPQ